MPITTCIFDAYGTLFDVSAAAREVAAEPGFEEFGDHWPKLASDWRLKQLQYSWLRAITNDHVDFWEITENALEWALQASGLLDDKNLRERLLQLYWELTAYPEVPNVLRILKARGMNTAILSNGSPAMLQAAVDNSHLTSLLDDILSVEAVGVFKPDGRVYGLVAERFNCANEDVLFVSSNGWDISGAAGFGFQTAWVNRAQDPVDRLPHVPHHELTDLIPIPDLTRP